ncbi:hypothetical protein D3C80_1273730 [compost metagenome]
MALASLVQGTGECLFAGAGFAVQKNRDVSVQHLAQAFHALLQLCVLACQLLERGVCSAGGRGPRRRRLAVTGRYAQAHIQQVRLFMTAQLSATGTAVRQVQQLVDGGRQQLLDGHAQQLAGMRQERCPIGADYPAAFVQCQQLLGGQVAEVVAWFDGQGQAVAVTLAEMAVLDQPGVQGHQLQGQVLGLLGAVVVQAGRV